MGKKLIAIEPRWWVVVIASGALALGYVDQEAVAVALPTIQRDLGMSPTELQLVVNAYLIALAACIALAGRAGDVFGHLRVFRWGVVVFLLASTACGLSGSVIGIVLGRLVQGMGAAMMVPNATAAVIGAFDPRSRGRALAFSVSIAMVFLTLGPPIGGLLTSLISWRAVFLVNPLLGTGLLALMSRVLPAKDWPPPTAPRGRIDWIAMPLIVLGLGSLTLGVMQTRQWGWLSAGVLGLLATAVVCLVATVVWERRQPVPLLELGLLSLPLFSTEVLVVSAIRFAVSGFTIFSVIWLQDVLGFSPLATGLSQLPFLLTLLPVTLYAGGLFDRIGARLPVAVGTVAISVSLLWMAAVLDRLSYEQLIAPYVLLGAGLGLAVSPAITDLLNSAPEGARGQTSGLVQTSREVGAALGIAVMGTVVSHGQAHRVRQLLTGEDTSPGRVAEVERSIGAAVADPASARIPAGLIPALQHAVTDAVATAYAVAGAVTGLGALLFLWRSWAVARADGSARSHR
ncbi:MFS transporter [Streptomyces sp. WAC06614]|uniref:MFS transporter n=1 Tax=Streptomyces sp. WAC06614 TaxID=2487416 RepID=UPI000F7A55A8|nr:MFS transporter [Streptomyces sp. WAC06614]RSS83678.1 MFS transporter [Streptomyces sp. WAC06614]